MQKSMIGFLMLLVLAGSSQASGLAPAAGITALEDAVKQTPDSAGARVKLGKAYFHAKRYRDAARQWNHVLKQHQATINSPVRVKLCLFIAQALLKDGDRAKAQLYLARAKKDSPLDAAVLRVAAMIQTGGSGSVNTGTKPDPTPSAAPDDGSNIPFIRVADLGGGKKALQTSRVVMRIPDGKMDVMLDGTIHLGEVAYYKEIQKGLDSAERVLYEAVIMTQADLKELGKPNPMDQAQKMATACGLAAQTLTIDYTRPNFIWADITLPELIEYQHTEAFREVALEAAAAAKRHPEKVKTEDEDFSESDMKDLMKPGASKKGGKAMELRRKLALSLQKAGDVSGLGMPAPVQELILYRRNDYVMAALKDQIEKKPTGSISIYYGAAHMQDIGRRLWQLGYRPVRTEWRTAWTFE